MEKERAIGLDYIMVDERAKISDNITRPERAIENDNGTNRERAKCREYIIRGNITAWERAKYEDNIT